MAANTYRFQRAFPLLPQVLVALAAGFALFVGAVVAWTLGYQLFYAGRVFPGVSVAGVDVSGLAPAEAAVKLSQTLSYPTTGKIVFRDGDQMWVASPVQLGMVFDPSASALAAYKLGRDGGLFGSLAGQIQARGKGVDMGPVIVFDQRVAYTFLQTIEAAVNRPVVEAGLSVQGTQVSATPGQAGRTLNLDATMIYLSGQLQSFRDGEVPLVIQESQPSIMDVSAQADAARAILSQPLTLSLSNPQQGDPGPWVYQPEVLANMLAVRRVEDGGQAEVQVGLDPNALREVLAAIQPQVDRTPQNARFYFDDPTAQLVLIDGSHIGRSLQIDQSIAFINNALARGEHSVALQVVEQQPAVGSDATAAQLGITQLISETTSYFYGSAPERIQNIQAAAARFHGILVAPGETFSMGQALGDVSLENGFAEALIIYGGRTIKGVGGGVCQVSTTLFRNVFYAGFPVIERYSHAYRVSYYEQTASGAIDPKLAGLDATVYFPLVDFKFKNDSQYWLLMETYTNPEARTLTWKFYSTPDGRSVTYETTGPQSIVKAPPPLFEENSELDRNQMKQVDWAANGADVDVTRTVWMNGQVYFQDHFQTHYEPWQAVCQYGPGTEDPEKMAKRKEICRAPAF
ncbi:MAG: VanW family protein [Bacteroidota bacterium]